MDDFTGSDKLRDAVLMIMYGKQVGGAELQFIELANFLAEKHAVRLLSLGGDGSVRGANLAADVDLKIYAYQGKLSAVRTLILAWLENYRYPSGAIVSTSFIGDVLGYLLGLYGEKRTVSLQTVSKCMRHPSISRFVLRRFHALIAGAEDIKKYLLAHLGSRSGIEVVHNWVDFSKRGSLPEPGVVKARLNLQDKLVIGCVGRLHPQKGQIYLIEAFAQIAKEIPNSMLMLVGEGAERATLEQRVDQLGLCDRVAFIGEVTGSGYNDMFAAMDIYVQPSLFEGLPRTLLDAMYYGKAIVASDINGNSEAIVSNRTGILVPSADAAALVVAIEKLANDDKYREELGAAAAQYVREHFEMRKQLGRIEHILLGPAAL